MTADPRNSEHAMKLAPDRCRYVRERPIADEPGMRWQYSGGAALRKRSRDLARIGELVPGGGVHEGTRLVPASWIEVSLEAHACVDDDLDYGYCWWVARRGLRRRRVGRKVARFPPQVMVFTAIARDLGYVVAFPRFSRRKPHQECLS